MKSPKTTSAASGPARFNASSPACAKFDDQPEPIGAAAGGFRQPGRRGVANVAGHRLGPVRLEQLVDVRGVHPNQDQRSDPTARRRPMASSTGP